MDALLHLNAALAGRYEIVREIGKGGMATVYLARDVRHQRQVALKLLSPELGAVLGVERFLSEIRVTANLQHPNLLPLFDSGEVDGLLFYVMPFVEGETLRHRLERERQLPVGEAVRIAVAVAAALDYAHRHGVIHRDLKPENILLHDGQPLVADFGIALAVSNAGGSRVTQTGLSLGTPQYMSPEQATGDRVIDGRTDIYSLGAVTYEMLAGEPPHAAATSQGVIAKLMTEDPRPLTILRRTVPGHVDAAVRHALEKLPADRFSSAHEFAEALENERAVAAPWATAHGERSRRSMVVAWGIAGIATGSAIAAIAYAVRSAPASPPLIRFKLDLPAGQQFYTAAGVTLALSPDGRTIVYAATGSQSPMLYMRRLDELQAKVIPGSENPFEPTFSRDGRWISFVDPAFRIERLPAQGGPAILLAKPTLWEGTSWSPDGAIVYSSHVALWQLASPGQTPRQITAIDTAHGEGDISAPYVFPNGQDVMFNVALGGAHGVNEERMGVVSMDGSNRVVLDKSAGNVVGYVDGWLLYGREDGRIEATRFNQRSHRFEGDAISLLDGVMYKSQGGVEAVLSSTGTLAYVRGETDALLTIADRRGGLTFSATERGRYYNPSWSPDAKKIAVAVEAAESSGGGNIWIYDVASKAFSRLTASNNAIRPAWTHDGKRVAFIKFDARSSSVWWAPADGSGPEELFYQLPGELLREVEFSADGRYAVLRTDQNPARPTKYDLYYLPLTAGAERHAVPLLQTSFSEFMPSLSPDSHWMAYQSDETGTQEIYVRPVPGPGGRVRVSTGGGVEPRWSADGLHIVYRGPRAFWSATISMTGGSPSVTGRDSLFADAYRRSDGAHQDYDLARDGRFAMFRNASGNASGNADLIVVTNWLSEVREKLRGK